MSRIAVKFFLFVMSLTLMWGESSWSYPEFIGYGYGACLTCHFNGNGNGPLNDYGRALWSAEIAGKLFAGKKTDEDLGNSAGFLGSTQLPWWIRPGIKTRHLQVQSNPGSKASSGRSILMQADLNLALFLDQDQKYAFIGSLGYMPEPQRLKGDPATDTKNVLTSREHYLRVGMGTNWWIYAGFLDKVYGIRIINHTAYSRSKTGLAQNDQSHGLILQYVSDKWEISGNAFAGNLSQETDLRQKGVSSMLEAEVAPNWRLGTSVLSSFSYYLTSARFGIHSRKGYGNGAAILFESGLISERPRVGLEKQGVYLYSEALQRIARGYHLFFVLQSYKDDMRTDRPQNIKTGLGLLAFPLARTELRFDLENARTYSSDFQVTPESWSLQSQLHLSF